MFDGYNLSLLWKFALHSIKHSTGDWQLETRNTWHVSTHRENIAVCWRLDSDGQPSHVKTTQTKQKKLCFDRQTSETNKTVLNGAPVTVTDLSFNDEA